MGFFEYLANDYANIFSSIGQHILLTIMAVCIAILVGIPLGILASYVKKLNKPIVWIANIMQSIPSIALLGFMIPLLGIGDKPAIAMVVIYSILPILKNTTTALAGIDKDIRDAARGIGMTKAQRLFKIKLPLAMPVIMSGIRISAVTAVGLVTIAGLVGAGGLGGLVYGGISTNNISKILAGAIPACILSLLVDFLLSFVEKALTPIAFSAKVTSANADTIKSHNKRKSVILSIISMIIVIAIVFNIVGCVNEKNTIKIGAKGFTEQTILANIYAELIEEDTSIKVDVKENLESNVIFSALKNKNIDFYIDYTATIYQNYLNNTQILTPEEIYAVSKQQLNDKHDLSIAGKLGFNNTYAFAISKTTQSKYGFTTITELTDYIKQFPSSLTLGCTYEFIDREDCLPNVENIYDFKLGSNNYKGFGSVIRYNAISNGEVEFIDAYTTDALIKEFDLYVLEDDKKAFMPYDAVPIFHNSTFEKFPQLEETIKKLEGKITEEIMIELNYQVDVQKQSAKIVAHNFLKSINLI